MPVAPAVATKGLADGTKAVVKAADGLKLVDRVSGVSWIEGMLKELVDSKWSSGLLAELKSDLSANPRMFDVFADNLKSDGAYAWRIVHSYPDLRKSPVVLKAVSDLLSDGKFLSAGLTPDLLEKLISGNRGAGAGALADLLGGYKTLVSSGTRFENLGAMVSEFNKGANFAEGERWIQRYILGNPDEFKGRVITFESRLDAGETVRRVDVISKIGDQGRPIYYEFKSVSQIPPQHFAKQFLNDLEVAENLNQIKWYFDGKKISKLDKELFLKELEKSEIKTELIRKWINNPRFQTKDELMNLISNNFDVMFEVK